MLLLSVLFFFCPLRPPAKRCDEHGCAISAAPLASSAPSPTPATWPSTARTAARASSPAPPLRPAPAPPASPPSRPAGSVSTSRSVTRPATVSFPHTPAAHATHTAHLLCTHTQRHHHPDRDVVNRPVMVCTSLLHRHAGPVPQLDRLVLVRRPDRRRDGQHPHVRPLWRHPHPGRLHVGAFRRSVSSTAQSLSPFSRTACGTQLWAGGPDGALLGRRHNGAPLYPWQQCNQHLPAPSAPVDLIHARVNQLWRSALARRRPQLRSQLRSQ